MALKCDSVIEWTARGPEAVREGRLNYSSCPRKPDQHLFKNSFSCYGTQIFPSFRLQTYKCVRYFVLKLRNKILDIVRILISYNTVTIHVKHGICVRNSITKTSTVLRKINKRALCGYAMHKP